jgi:hypothetical protein
VKRGLITWDKDELPPEVFDRRMEPARRVLIEHQLSALIVYADLWRSNHARFFANYMPYFNRALLILPVEGKPTLLCGLSPRTYRWIRSVTPIEDIRPAGNFLKPLEEIATERGWTGVGMLDRQQLPYDLWARMSESELGFADIPSEAVVFLDEHEFTMRRTAAELARTIVWEELDAGVGKVDYELVGTLERRLRLAGAEDLVILLTNGDGPPAPARGRNLQAGYSVSLALEYRGHWVRMSAVRDPAIESPEARSIPVIETLSGPYPYEVGRPEALYAKHAVLRLNGRQFVVGGTLLRTEEESVLL